MPKDLGEMLVVDTLNRMDNKLDRLDERLDKVDGILTIQQAILDEHVRRTNLLEKKIDADAAALKETIGATISTKIQEERKELALKVGKGGLKVGAAVAGTGVGMAMVKEFLTWLLHFWK